MAAQSGETRRLDALGEYEILDTPAEETFDDLVKLAAALCRVPISAVSLVDAERQWFKAVTGFDQKETSRDLSICQHTMLEDDLLVIPDALADERFKKIAENLGLRFYAGAPLVSPEGAPLGALCIIDVVPRTLTAPEADALRLLGRAAQARLDQHRSMMQLKRSEERFRKVFDSSPIGMALVGASGPDRLRVLASNSVYAEMLGRGIEEVEGELYVDLLSPDDYRFCETVLDELMTKDVVAEERLVEQPDGSEVWVKFTASRIPGRSGSEHVVVQAEDVTASKHAHENLVHTAMTDALTGLPNRRAAAAHLEALEAAKGGHTALLFVDLDRFKSVNDSWGHDAGDQLLVQVAERLKESMRSGDFAARLGGDEFVVCCTGLGDDPAEAVASAEDIAGRINAALTPPALVQGREMHVTASVGIAIAGPSVGGGAKLLQDADAAMYKAKQNGRACHAVFDDDLRAALTRRAQLEMALPGAVERGEMQLVYQPIVKLPTGELIGHETLLRWGHEEEAITPDEFIPIAEETGSVVGIGTWVLHKALAEHCEARERGWVPPEGYVLSVNISAHQVSQEGFVDLVMHALAESGAPPSVLALEVTEGAMLSAGPVAGENLAKLRAAGVEVGVDDFGTGYASLTYLKSLPASFVKVDKSFVAGMLEREEDKIIVTAVVNLAHALHLEVIAEGVETPEQGEALALLGCTHAQGWHYGRPGPLPAV